MTSVSMTMVMRPLTQAGRDWLSDNLPKGDLRVGSNAFIPGNRITATLTGILKAGLSIAAIRKTTLSTKTATNSSRKVSCKYAGLMPYNSDANISIYLIVKRECAFNRMRQYSTRTCPDQRQ